MSSIDPYSRAPYATTPDGATFEYRLVNSRLERRALSSACWYAVTGEEFLCMGAAELRIVAAVLERRGAREEEEPR